MPFRGIASLKVERAREALKRGDLEKVILWLQEGVAHAAEANDVKLLSQLGDEASLVARPEPKLRADAQRLAREARRLAKQLPSEISRKMAPATRVAAGRG